jgi:hypothetical protein
MAYKIRNGVRDRSNGESWTEWWVLTFDTAAEAEAAVAAGDVAYYCGNPGPYYGGPGRTFLREPFEKLVGRRVLVTQYGGLDI